MTKKTQMKNSCLHSNVMMHAICDEAKTNASKRLVAVTGFNVDSLCRLFPSQRRRLRVMHTTANRLHVIDAENSTAGRLSDAYETFLCIARISVF
jgi:hypothetical protein